MRELFVQANEWFELAVGTLETIAIYRLLIAIAQRALDGPKTSDDWKTVGERLVGESLKYLDVWKDRFDLFGDKPFLQRKALEAKKRSKTDKLDFALASGNNSTLFDQNAVAEGRPHDSAWLARKMLVYQSFSPGGTIGKALSGNVQDKKTDNKGGNDSSHNAPCAEGNMLIALLKGASVFETLWWNLVPFDTLPESLGKPIWEYDDLTEKDCQEIAQSWFGRLVPIARSILLEKNGLEMILANGLDYPKLPAFREPMGSVFKKDGPEWKYVRTDPAQHPWRNLHAILALGKRDDVGGALALGINIPSIVESTQAETFELWVGGVATDQAKILDAPSWSVPIDRNLIGSISLANYEEGVKKAVVVSKRLVKAVEAYCNELMLESEKKGRENVSSLVVRAKNLYWSALDLRYSVLLKESEEQDGAPSEWQKILESARDSAYERVCSRRSARRLQAFVKGKRSLFNAVKKTNQETRESQDAKKTKSKRVKKNGKN